jgi:hypothetical protein
VPGLDRRQFLSRAILAGAGATVLEPFAITQARADVASRALRTVRIQTS